MRTLPALLLAALVATSTACDKKPDASAEAASGPNPEAVAHQVDIHLLKSMSLRDEGKPLEAELQLTMALALDPKNANVLFERGRVRKDQKHFDPAIEDYTAALANVGTDADLKPEILYRRGEAYAAKGDKAKALADFKEALRVAPKDWVYDIDVEVAMDEIAPPEPEK